MNLLNEEGCPAEALLKLLAVKWTLRILRLAAEGPVRFNHLLRQLENANKQSLSVALRELETEGLLEKTVIAEKPLHIEYRLTARGEAVIPVLKKLEGL